MLLAAALTEGCEAGPSPQPTPSPEERRPLGIVSLTPEVDRVLQDLGVADEIVADAGDLGELDPAAAARVAGLAPDLVIGLADARSRGFAEQLEALGIHAVLLAPLSANQVDASVLRIGELVARETRARVVAARIAREISEIATSRDGRSRRRVALLVRCQPLTVVGGAGLVHETLELAGAENVFHEPGIQERVITPSELAQRGPEIVLDASGAGAPLACPGAASSGARVEPLPARLAALPAIDLVARVRSLHQILYPGS
jgi:ABC-type Fe3+-hydroxamate transport system substrate-binding protein